MHQVMHKAQELAEAIVDSAVYQRMHQAEIAATKDETATAAIAAFVEKRQAVENLLASNNMDHAALAEASTAMEAAEKALNEVPAVKEMQEARAEFTQMMENVNRILRLVITGETEEEHDCNGDCSSCGGSCSTCGGCH